MERTLRLLDKRMGKRARREIGRILSRAVTPAMRTVRGRTPIDTGTLRKSLKRRVRLQKSGAAVYVGYVRKKGRKPRFSQVMGIEYGNRQTPAPTGGRQSIEKGFKRHARGITRAVEEGIAELVDKEFAKAGARGRG